MDGEKPPKQLSDRDLMIRFKSALEMIKIAADKGTSTTMIAEMATQAMDMENSSD
ncbi:hypothetical protein SUFG_00061 [Sulfitobacter phage phiCB2047-B]|uniref:Uncharacterized protein n=1 Tax=Sulfitobacter phage phiCB2047-B TaxID=754046 RepID=M4PN11_9CAUD|nr:hypothetical protein SUFG_00061 [Sulfitobacter phage phiCB2047-B]AGH07428.1 hypothetical protein SUFG_00061 [Sulfitobacter phage phiCB2047-B]